MITVKNLTKKYGDRAALDSLSFTISKGGIHGILGPHGAGKTTLMNIISGYLLPDGGDVTLSNAHSSESVAEARGRIGYLPEALPLYENMTVRELLVFVAEVKKVPEDRIEKNVARAMELTYIDEFANRLAKNLSPDIRKLLGLAMAMLGNPDVILIDEPTKGLNPAQRAAIRDIIAQLGEIKTVIVSSSDIYELKRICRDIVIISDGRKIAEGEIDELERRLSKTRALVISVRGDEGRVIDALGGVEEIIDCTVMGHAKGVVNLKLEFEADKEIRDTTFAALAEAGCPILSMDTEAVTLEEIYFKLTASAEKGEGKK
ncbi:MAG: ABC transporter ATP-binding protein [Clostridia bacterium]|nr:ABC transporter ATP-binding protein [Clostridia bacterium]